MGINLKEARRRLYFSKHDLSVLNANIRDFPLEEALLEQQIEFKITDYDDRSHHMTYHTKRGLLIDGVESALEAIYPLAYRINTNAGMQAAYNYEASMVRDNLIVSKAAISETRLYLQQKYSLDYSPERVVVKDLPDAGKIQFHFISPNDHSIAIQERNKKKFENSWIMRGVARYHPTFLKGDWDIGLIISDPLLADYFGSIGIAAISQPSLSELAYYDYANFFKDKRAILVTSNSDLDPDFSHHCIAEELLINGVSVSTINSTRILEIQRGTIEKDAFMGQVIDHSSILHPSDLPSTEYQADDQIETIDPAQDTLRQSMIFKIDSSSQYLITSPLRLIDAKQLSTYENASPRIIRDTIETDVTLERIQKIQSTPHFNAVSHYSTIKSFLKRFVYIEHEGVYDLITCWVLGTYFFKLFRAYPYLHFDAEHGSGKSTILEIISHLSFNGAYRTSATVASLIELINTRSSTLGIDEFEEYAKKGKSHDNLSKFLNGGYQYQGIYTKRVGNETREYRTYSPKAFSATKGVQLETLKSRMITISMKRKSSDIALEDYDQFDDEVLKAIDHIKTHNIKFPITFLGDLQRIIMEPDNDITLPVSGEKISNRQYQLSFPLITISKLIDGLDGTNKRTTRILSALDNIWFPEEVVLDEREVALKKQFQEWNNDENFDLFTHKNGHIVIPNRIIRKSKILLDQFSDDNEIIKWLRTLENDGIRKDSVHIPTTGKTESCTLFPLDLNIGGHLLKNIFKK